MTQDKARKSAARQRMAQTGEPYSVARRAVQAGADAGEAPPSPRDQVPDPGDTALPDPATTMAESGSDWDALTPEEQYALEAAEAGVSAADFEADLSAFRIADLAEQAQRAADEARERAERVRELADRAEEVASEAEDQAGLADEEAELAMYEDDPRAQQTAQERADRAEQAAEQARERADAAEEQAVEAEEQADELEDLAAAYAERAGNRGPGGDRRASGRAGGPGPGPRQLGRSLRDFLGRGRTVPGQPRFLPPVPPGRPGPPASPHPPAPPHPPSAPHPPGRSG
jgi:hypothetical protein